MKTLYISVVLGALFLAVGCASTTQMVPLPDQRKRVENPGYARIYVMRAYNFFGSGASCLIKDGDKEIGYPGNNGYLCWEREPGKIIILGKGANTAVLDLTAEKNMVYYIQQFMTMGAFSACNSLNLLSEYQGKELLKQCKPPTVKLKEKPASIPEKGTKIEP
jgi:hypothetical protein